MYKMTNAIVALRKINEVPKLQEESNYNTRYTLQLYIPTAILKLFCL